MIYQQIYFQNFINLHTDLFKSISNIYFRGWILLYEKLMYLINRDISNNRNFYIFYIDQSVTTNNVVLSNNKHWINIVVTTNYHMFLYFFFNFYPFEWKKQTINSDLFVANNRNIKKNIQQQSVFQ